MEADLNAQGPAAPDADPEARHVGELVVLDRRAVRFADVLVLGCRLFSRIAPAQRHAVRAAVADFYHTGDEWDVAAHNAAHARDLVWLNRALGEAEADKGVRAVVVLSHWKPTVDPRTVAAAHARSEVGSAFQTDLAREACWAAGKLRVWACGHTHFNFDVRVERVGGGKGGKEGAKTPVRVVANQMGYASEQVGGFEEGKVVIV
jgi:hypothetical protein